MLVSRGEGRAKQFGWSEPFPDVSHLVDLRAQTETMTDEIMTRFFDRALNADESAELLDLVLAMKSQLDAVG